MTKANTPHTLTTFNGFYAATFNDLYDHGQDFGVAAWNAWEITCRVFEVDPADKARLQELGADVFAIYE